MPKYKWNNPLEWLEEKIMGAGSVEAHGYALLIAKELTPDQIQDIFQEEMNEDGYFTPLAQEKKDSDG